MRYSITPPKRPIITAKPFLNVGVIGLGEQSCENLIPALLLSEYATLRAVCDINQDAVKLAAQRFNIGDTFHDYNDLLQSEDIDAVVIASHPNVHYEVTKKALQKGKHVFVEKPPVENAVQLDELLDLQKKHSTVTVGVGMNFDFTEMAESVREILKDKNFFGDLARVKITHHSNKPRSPFWNYDNITDSFLLAQMIHPLHQTLVYGGEVKDFVYRSSPKDSPFFVDVIINFQDGTVGVIESSTYYPYFEHCIELYGASGVIVSINNINHLRVITSAEKRRYFKKAPSLNFAHSPLSSSFKNAGYANELDAFFNAVVSGKRFKADLQSMKATYAILDQLAKELKQKYVIQSTT